VLESRLDRVGDDLVGIDGAAPRDLVPRPPELHAPRAGVRRGIAHEATGFALAHDQPVGSCVLVELLPLAVVVGNDQRHAAVLNWLRHQSSLSSIGGRTARATNAA